MQPLIDFVMRRPIQPRLYGGVRVRILSRCFLALTPIFWLFSAINGNAQTPLSGFLADTESELDRLAQASTLAWWNYKTNINDETRKLAIEADAALDKEKKARSAQLRAMDLRSATRDEARKLLLLKLQSDGIVIDPKLAQQFANIKADMEKNYAQACPFIDVGRSCMPRGEIELELQSGRNPDRLRTLWLAWYDTARPIGRLYPSYVELSNRGARDSGYSDAASMSKAAYEVDPVEFERDLDNLWAEIRPLYLLLHAYVRKQLVAAYGKAAVDPSGPIPIHLLGNLWGQDWENIADLLAIPGGSTDYSAALKKAKLTPSDFINVAERFFTSLDFPALPPTFRERSYFTQPRPLAQPPDFDCHPSAWIISPSDWRLKTCLEISWTDFLVVHHEMGHIFYYQSFSPQPFLFRDAPNEGINEAIGDAAALSVTPEYLRRIGILSSDGTNDDLNQLMHVALRKLARVPFGLMLQKWRWGVMSGKIAPEHYNDEWWGLVRKYQGIAPPAHRPADAFDPGAKEHIAADIDYTRYFLADVLTFQIHEALSHEAGCTAQLHRCSIFENNAAGSRWRSAMQLGSSRPWTEVLELMTGGSRIQGRSMRNYLAPLEEWLKQETRGDAIGWEK